MDDMVLKSTEVELLPTAEDVSSYREHGFYKSRKLFTDEEVDRAAEAQELFYQGKVDDPGIAGIEKYRPEGHPGESLGKNDFASFFVPGLAELSRKPIVAAIAARLAGTASIRLWHDQLLYKPATRPDRPVSVGWHTDRQYWKKTCSSKNMITAWIPFHDCDDVMGTISVVDGSHGWPDNTEDLDFFLRETDNEELEQRFVTGGNDVVKVPVDLKKGEVSFHHCMAIHGSGPNLSDRPRRSIAVHMQDQDNQYVKTRNPDGTVATANVMGMCRYVDGVPDFSDPIICPELYRET